MEYAGLDLDKKMEYSKDDVIIWPDDPRLKDAVGKRCYVDDSVLGCLKKAYNKEETTILEYIDKDDEFPFVSSYGDGYSSCIIIEKEPKENYRPFDLSKREDRDTLMGKRIASTKWNVDILVTAIFKMEDDEWRVNKPNIDADMLLDDFVFVNTGNPVGKEK